MHSPQPGRQIHSAIAKKKQSDLFKSMMVLHFIGRNHVIHLSSCSFKLFLSYFAHRNLFQVNPDSSVKIKGSEICKVLAGFFPHFWVSWEHFMLYWWVIFRSYMIILDTRMSCEAILKCNQQAHQDIQLEVSSGSASYLAWPRQSAAQPALISEQVQIQTAGLRCTAITIAPHVHQRFFHDKRRQKTILRHLLVWGMAGQMWLLQGVVTTCPTLCKQISVRVHTPNIWVAGAPKPSDHHRRLFVKDSVSNRSTRCEWFPNSCICANGIWL